MAATKQDLLDFIGWHEARGNYNAYYGHAANQLVDFSKMTVSEVRQWQRDYLAAGSPSSAVGKYQIVSKTLKSLVRAGVVSNSDKFDAATQDKLGGALLRARGYDAYAAGKISAEAFGNRLAREWAALPVLTGASAGRSYYAGDGLNRAGTTVGAVLSVLNGHPTPEAYIPETRVASELDVSGPTSLAQLIAGSAGNSSVPLPRPRPLFAPLPAPEPLKPSTVSAASATILGGAAVAGKAARDAAVSTILGGGSGVSKVSASPGRKLPNPTAAETRAEQVLGRKAAATPAARSIVPALGRSTEQVARDEQNAIQSGYRAVQEGKFPAAPNAQKQTPAAPAATSGQPSGVQKSTTVYVRPDGAARAVDLAGSVQMAKAIAAPTLAETRAEQAVARSALTRTITVEEDNPAYYDWLHTYANASGSPDDRDARSAMSKLALGVAGGVAARVPAAPPRRITITRTVPVHASTPPASNRLSVQQQIAAQQAAKARAAILSAYTQAAASSMPQAGQTIMTENNGAQIIGSRLNGSERGLTVTNDNWFNSVRGL